MAIRVAINGFGRIGRTFLRAIMQDEFARSNINVVAINEGPCSCEHLGVLFKYDSVMGTFPGDVSVKNCMLTVNNHQISLFCKSDPASLPWKKLDIDWVIEASGQFTKKEDSTMAWATGNTPMMELRSPSIIA